MALQLPKFLALKSATRYLSYRDRIDGVREILQFSGEEVVTPYTQFQVEATDNPNRVHIRSCYNNKYLRRASQNLRLIVAGADERQQDDQKLWSCTLFEPIRNGAQIHFRHVQLGNYLKIAPNGCLFVSADKDFDVFTIIDWDALVILPKFLAFRGDNGKYISVMDDQYLQFSATHPTDPKGENEVFPAGDGSVSIKNTFTQNFWMRNSNPSDNILNNWIWADANGFPNQVQDVDKLFCPVKVNTNDGFNDVVVALRNLGNNNYCRRLTLENDDKEGCLIADLNTITPQAHLAVEELVVSRTISLLNFRFSDARIYNRSIDEVVATGEYKNFTGLPVSVTISLSYMDTKVSTWNTIADDAAFTAFIQTTLTSDTPFILEGDHNIGVSGNFNGTYQWGQPHKSSTPIERWVRVVVQPMQKVTVKLLATKASFDVPFDYSKQDTLISSRIITYGEEVGLYTGFCLYNFKQEKQEVAL